MSTMITINVTNNSRSIQNFYFFQQPAQYAGGAQVYTNSLFMSALPSYATSGAVLSFTMVLQNYACVQQQTSPPQVGQRSGQHTQSQPIGLTGGAPNTTRMAVSPSLELSAPVPASGLQPGSFRIITPTYNAMMASYNAGSGVQTLQGGVILSSFVTAQPNNNLDCQPVLRFYVQTGTYSPGTVMNFTSASISAAVCDATSGHRTFNVAYNVDGTWSVQLRALVQGADGQPMLVDD